LLFCNDYEGYKPKMTTASTKNQPVRVLIDSNALFVPLQFKIDIFTELEYLLSKNFTLVLLSPVKKELQTLTQKSTPKKRKDAAFALSLAKKCTYIKVKEKPNELTDDAILRIAQEWNAPVFTNDKLLKKRLRDISVPVIYVREKSRLEIDGMI
jgi:rRNA-processing protein FCF1